MLADPRCFDDEHLPRRLLHRSAERDTLLRAWDPGHDGDGTDDVLLYGPHGVGKTVLAKAALRDLGREYDYQTAHVNCLGKTTAGILREVLTELPGEDPYKTMPLEDLAMTLHDRVGDPVIVVLDEGDDLPETDALARLTEVRDLAVVAICHDPDNWLARVDDSIRRRFRAGPQLGLDRYGTDELADILDERAQIGLHPTAITRSQLERIADDVAGVARKGIQALREAARLATERGHMAILDDDIEDAYPRANRQIRRSNLASLPYHHQVIYECIRTADDPVDGRALHSRYDELAEQVYAGVPQTPLSKRQRRNKLPKLQEYDLIDWQDKPREYWVCDEAVEAGLDALASAQF